MPSAPTHPSTRPAARKSRAPRRASAYPSPVMSDAAVVEPYRISQYVRCSQSPAASTEHDSVSSLDSDWPPTSRGASLPQDAPISPYCLSLAATPGLGIKYSPALFPGPDMASMPPTTVSPSMLECHHSTAHFSNASICSSIYEASEDAPSLDDYDMIHTPEPFLHDDATRIADDRTWFTSPGGAYEPTTLHHPLQLQYGPSEASCGMPPADFNGYELRRPVKRELHSQSPMQQDSEQDDESSSSSSPSSSGDDDMDDDTDIKSEAAARHPYNKPYENPKYTCATCGKDFMRTFNYNSHLATHNPQRERPFNCRWSSCDKKFFRSTDLKRHELSVHVKSEDFRCGTCGSGFPRKDSLQRHRKDGCAHRSAVTHRAAPARRHSKPATDAARPGHVRRSSRVVAKHEYLPRDAALGLAHAHGVLPDAGPYFVERASGLYGSPESP